MHKVILVTCIAAIAANNNCQNVQLNGGYAQRSDIDRIEFEIGQLGTFPVLLSDDEYSGKLEWVVNSGTVAVQARALHASADCILYESSPVNVALPAGDETVSIRMQLLNLFPRPSTYNKRPVIVITTVSPQQAFEGQKVIFLVEARDHDGNNAPTLLFTHNGGGTLEETCETYDISRLCMLHYVITSSDSGTLQLDITASDGTLTDTASVTHDVVARSNALDGTFYINEGPYLTDITEGNSLLHSNGQTTTTHSVKVYDETATDLTYSWQVQGDSTYCSQNDMTFQASGQASGVSGAVGSIGGVVSVTHVPSVFPPATDITQKDCELTLTVTDEHAQSVTTNFIHLVSSDPTPSHPYITLVYHTANSTHRMSMVRAHSPYDSALKISWDTGGFAASSGDADMTRTSSNTYEWQHAVAISDNVQGYILYELEDLTTNLGYESLTYTIAAYTAQQRRRLLEVAKPNNGFRRRLDEVVLDTTVGATVVVSSSGAHATVDHIHDDEGSSDSPTHVLGIAFGISIGIYLLSGLV